MYKFKYLGLYTGTLNVPNPCYVPCLHNLKTFLLEANWVNLPFRVFAKEHHFDVKLANCYTAGQRDHERTAAL